MRKLVVAVAAVLFGMSFGTVFALDPLNNEDAAKDYDVDGLSNLMEFAYGTDPYNMDTDGDGCPDGWVAYYDQNRAWFPADNGYAVYDTDGDGVNDANVDPNYKFDPTNSLTASDKPDDDGWDNLREYQEGTDPTNPDTDHDGYIDSNDPRPLIPDDPWKDGGGGSGQAQGIGMAAELASTWC
jgi:hypothetical protein